MTLADGDGRARAARHGAEPQDLPAPRCRRMPVRSRALRTCAAWPSESRSITSSAEALWQTGNVDARSLATMIVDPARMSGADLDRWLEGLDYYLLASLVAGVAARTPHACAKADEWTARPGELDGEAGWDLVALLAKDDGELSDAYFEDKLPTLERADREGAEPNAACDERGADRDRWSQRRATEAGARGRRENRRRRGRSRRDGLQDAGRGALHREDLGPSRGEASRLPPAPASAGAAPRGRPGRFARRRPRVPRGSRRPPTSPGRGRDRLSRSPARRAARAARPRGPRRP